MEQVRQVGRVFFPTLLGLVVEEVRVDYCRMRLPFRPELEQPAGLVHGGAIASLLDSVVVPAVGSAYGADARYSTVDMHVQFIERRHRPRHRRRGLDRPPRTQRRVLRVGGGRRRRRASSSPAAC